MKIRAAVLRRVGGKLGRRKGEDEPAAARVDAVEAEDVAEERAHRIRLARVADRVDAGDHRAQSLSPRGARRYHPFP